MKLEFLRPDKPKRRRTSVKIAYSVKKHLLFPYDKHLRNGDVVLHGKVIGNTHDGNMICGLVNINKIVFR